MKMGLVVLALALLVVPSFAAVVTVSAIPTASPGAYQLYSIMDNSAHYIGTGNDTISIQTPTTCAYPGSFSENGATGVKGYTGTGFLQMTATAFGPSTGVAIDIPVGDLPFTTAGLASLQLSYNWQMHPMYGPGRNSASYPGNGDNNEYAPPVLRLTISDPGKAGGAGTGYLLWDPSNNPMPHLGVYDPAIPDGGMWDNWCPEPGNIGPTSSTIPGTYYPYISATTPASGNGWTEASGTLYGYADYDGPPWVPLNNWVSMFAGHGSVAPCITQIALWSGDWTGQAVQYVDDVRISFNSFDTTYDFDPAGSGGGALPEPATVALMGLGLAGLLIRRK